MRAGVCEPPRHVQERDPEVTPQLLARVLNTKVVIVVVIGEEIARLF